MLGKPRTDTTALRLERLDERLNPVIIPGGDQYTAVAGQILQIPLSQGVLVNDFSDTNPGVQLKAALASIPRYVQPAGSTTILPPLPAFGGQGAVQLNQDGSFRFLAPPAGQVPPGVDQVSFTYTVSNAAGETAVGTVVIDLALGSTQLIAVGPEAGSPPIIRAFESGSGAPIGFIENLQPYESSFTNGVRVATGDVNGDGIDDIATVPATGGSPRLVLFSGKDGARLIDQIVIDPDFRGGAYVTIGDYNGDGRNDLIVGAGEGGGPRVSAFQFNRPVGGPAAGPQGTLTQLGDFFVFESTARNGVRVAAGDLRGEGRDLLVVSPGVGGGPRVRVIDPQATGITQNSAGGRPIPAGQIAVSVQDFFAADSASRDGVYIATGNLRGDGKFDIITGSGSGSALVQVFDGRTGGLVRQFTPPAGDVTTGAGGSGAATGSTVTGLQAGGGGTLLNPGLAPGSLVPGGVSGQLGTNPFFRTVSGGARVAATDYNGDGLDDFVVATGPGNVSRVRVFDVRNETLLTSIQPFGNTFLGGVNVAAS